MTRSTTLALVFALFATAAGAARADEDARSITKPIDRMIQLIRYGKFEAASKSLDHRGMAELLLRDTWAGMTDAEKDRFVAGFAYLMENLSFPKVKESFEYLDDISYGTPEIDGDRARVTSVIVIDHPTKDEEEIALAYVMRRGPDGAWRVLDVFLDDESTLDGIREDQIEELLEDGGVKLLLQKLDERVAEIKAERAAEAAGHNG